MTSPYAALHASLFDTLSEPVSLQRDDNLPITVPAIVRLGVTNAGEFGRVVGSRTTVSLPRDQWQPRRGDRVTLRGVTYTVEAIASDDGYVVEAILHG